MIGSEEVDENADVRDEAQPSAGGVEMTTPKPIFAIAHSSAGDELLNNGKLSSPSSSVRSLSPTPSISAFDKATLQQRIHQKLRMYNSGMASSDDSDDDLDAFQPFNGSSGTSGSLHPIASKPGQPVHRVATPVRSISPRPASVRRESDVAGVDDSLLYSLTWPEVDALQSHYANWPAEDTRDWRKIKNFMVKLLTECALLDAEDMPPVDLPETVEGDVKWGSIGDPSDFVLNLISKIESNGFGLWSPKKGVCMGRAIFPRASYFNVSILASVAAKSCVMNAYLRYSTLATQILNVCRRA